MTRPATLVSRPDFLRVGAVAGHPPVLSLAAGAEAWEPFTGGSAPPDRARILDPLVPGFTAELLGTPAAAERLAHWVALGGPTPSRRVLDRDLNILGLNPLRRLLVNAARHVPPCVGHYLLHHVWILGVSRRVGGWCWQAPPAPTGPLQLIVVDGTLARGALGRCSATRWRMCGYWPPRPRTRCRAARARERGGPAPAPGARVGPVRRPRELARGRHRRGGAGRSAGGAARGLVGVCGARRGCGLLRRHDAPSRDAAAVMARPGGRLGTTCPTLDALVTRLALWDRPGPAYTRPAGTFFLFPHGGRDGAGAPPRGRAPALPLVPLRGELDAVLGEDLRLSRVWPLPYHDGAAGAGTLVVARLSARA